MSLTEQTTTGAHRPRHHLLCALPRRYVCRPPAVAPLPQPLQPVPTARLAGLGLVAARSHHESPRRADAAVDVAPRQGPLRRRRRR